MNLSERDNFDEQWRKAFEEASEAPPPSLWGAIEERLDEKKKEGLILPLWWKSAPMRYAAATVAVMLLVGWSVWFLMHQNPTSSLTTVAVKPDSVFTKNGNASPEQLAKNQLDENAADKALPEARSSKEIAVSLAKERLIGHSSKKLSRALKRAAQSNVPEALVISETSTAPELAILKEEQVSSDVNNEQVSDTKVETRDVTERKELQPIRAKGFQELAVYPQRRYVFYKVAQADYLEPKRNNKSKKEYWAGVGLMPSSFDPNVNVKSAPLFSNLISNGQSMSNSNVAETSTSEARLSYSVQAQTGMKISKNWSIETGVSYLQGNSVFRSEGYALDKLSSRSSNVLESAIYSGNGTKAPEYMLTAGDAKAEEPTGLYIDVSQRKSNEYRYLQLPVQLGYTLNPSGKLSYTVLGGMVGNFFLQNQLETNSGYVLTTKANDNVYRSLNWAGSSGLRFNFRFSPHWVMNMTGSFQKSFMTIFKDNNNLESKPQLYGVGWGMRYTF